MNQDNRTIVFRERDAKDFGVTKAIILEGLRRNQRYAEENNEPDEDGRVWFKVALKALARLYPFWSYYAIKTGVRALYDHGVIEIKRVGWDRSNHYHVKPEYMAEHNSSNSTDPLVENDTTARVETQPLEESKVKHSNGRKSTDYYYFSIKFSKDISKEWVRAWKRKLQTPRNKDYPEEFEETWKHYPRKTNKRQAAIAWLETLNKGAEPDELFTATKRYASKIRNAGTEEKFIKMGSTFFGPQLPWEDFLDDGSQAPAPEPEDFTNTIDLEFLAQ